MERVSGGLLQRLSKCAGAYFRGCAPVWVLISLQKRGVLSWPAWDAQERHL